MEDADYTTDSRSDSNNIGPLCHAAGINPNNLLTSLQSCTLTNGMILELYSLTTKTPPHLLSPGQLLNIVKSKYCCPDLRENTLVFILKQLRSDYTHICAQTNEIIREADKQFFQNKAFELPEDSDASWNIGEEIGPRIIYVGLKQDLPNALESDAATEQLEDLIKVNKSKIKMEIVDIPFNESDAMGVRLNAATKQMEDLTKANMGTIKTEQSESIDIPVNASDAMGLRSTDDAATKQMKDLIEANKDKIKTEQSVDILMNGTDAVADVTAEGAFNRDHDYLPSCALQTHHNTNDPKRKVTQDTAMDMLLKRNEELKKANTDMHAKMKCWNKRVQALEQGLTAKTAQLSKYRCALQQFGNCSPSIVLQSIKSAKEKSERWGVNVKEAYAALKEEKAKNARLKSNYSQSEKICGDYKRLQTALIAEMMKVKVAQKKIWVLEKKDGEKASQMAVSDRRRFKRLERKNALMLKNTRSLNEALVEARDKSKSLERGLDILKKKYLIPDEEVERACTYTEPEQFVRVPRSKLDHDYQKKSNIEVWKVGPDNKIYVFKPSEIQGQTTGDTDVTHRGQQSNDHQDEGHENKSQKKAKRKRKESDKNYHEGHITDLKAREPKVKRKRQQINKEKDNSTADSEHAKAKSQPRTVPLHVLNAAAEESDSEVTDSTENDHNSTSESESDSENMSSSSEPSEEDVSEWEP